MACWRLAEVSECGKYLQYSFKLPLMNNLQPTPRITC